MTPIQLMRYHLAAWLAMQAASLARLQGREAANEPLFERQRGKE